eukprot:CAMPEP_0184738484 /NCGR_PEP_ID=MMETSP0315-20130426/1101_1 /TAXON_ID=101924 /ORGANISM="Rhodosorus marinus, Strain UTEX LB 2760" /LENGTH=150 /DNA_ID=CAMNT_0027206187 /DNA_START=77 /DNA_END=529 /DNA_ORIENTATION=-
MRTCFVVGFTDLMGCGSRLQVSKNSCGKRRRSMITAVDEEDDPMLADIAAMKKRMEVKKSLEKKDSGGIRAKVGDATTGMQDFVSTLLLYNFFAVIFFLVWLAIGAGMHFVLGNDTLLDPWLQIWTPLIQPLLGVLMLGTIVSGTFSKMR